MILADFHCHTKYSYDSDTSLEEAIRQCKEKGVQKIAITDHNTIEGALKAHQLAPEMIIIGEEISSTRGDIIGLFLRELVPEGLSARETATRIKAQGGLVYIPHPFDRIRAGIGEKGLEEIHDLIDIIEVFNGKTVFPSMNRKAWGYAKKHKFPMAAGSDSHQPGTIGETHNRIPDFQTPDELLQSLRQNKRTQEFLGLKVYVRSMWSLLKSLIRKKGKKDESIKNITQGF